jgi:hypothetical protein
MGLSINIAIGIKVLPTTAPAGGGGGGAADGEMDFSNADDSGMLVLLEDI